MIFRQQALHLMNHMKLLSVHNKIQQEKERKQQFDIYQEGSSPILFKIDSLNDLLNNPRVLGYTNIIFH